MNAPHHAGSPDFAASLRSSIQQNPLAAGLIGLGALWLLLGNRYSRQGLNSAAGAVSSGVKESAARVAAGAKAAAASTQEAVSGAAESVSGTMTGLARSVQETAGSLAATAQSTVGNAAGSTTESLQKTIRTSRETGQTLFNDLQHVLERQPLLIGGLGLAIGSVVAASLPSSRLESEVLGPSSDAVKQGLRDSLGDQTGLLTAATSRVFEAVKNESEAQGLTKEGLKDDLQQKFSEFSDAVRNSVKERTS